MPEQCFLKTCRCPTNGEMPCGGVCKNMQTDNANCGSCGNACTGPTSCAMGMCKCPTAGETVCGTTCVNRMTDPMNCGSCGTVCSGATNTCCNGTCKDLQADKTACGACGTACPMMTTDRCTAGACKCNGASPCMPGFFGVGGTCGAPLFGGAVGCN